LGARLTRIVSYGFGTITPSGVAGDGHGGLWWMTAFPYPALLHWTGGKLMQVTLPAPTAEVDLYSLARTSAAGAMFLGGQLRSGNYGPALVESTRN
jgi:hypothetical protein